MPPIAASLVEARVAVENPERLFDKHGAVFLLMHSRESRCLPTVLGAAKEG